MRSTFSRLGWRATSVATVVAVLGAGVPFAPPASGDSADSLRSAVTQVRQAACGPLRDDPLVEQAADIVNRSTDEWINHASRAAPVDKDPLPILKDRGYQGNKAALALGAGRSVAESIKMLLLQGYNKIPDCSYTDYGVSVMQNPNANQGFSNLTVLILAGP
jgi:hypothetical protein